MFKILNLDFSNKTIGSIEANNENINNLEVKLTKTKLTISFNNNNEIISKKIKKEKNEVIIDIIYVEEEEEEQPQEEPQEEPKEEKINIEDYKTSFFTELLNKNYNIYNFLVSNERNFNNYINYIKCMNEEDKELFSYLLAVRI